MCGRRELGFATCVFCAARFDDAVFLSNDPSMENAERELFMHLWSGQAFYVKRGDNLHNLFRKVARNVKLDK